MRNWNDPQYKEWRIKVLKRDNFKCKKCGARRNLQVHHIKSWANYPQSRFVLENGITLCKKCHRLLWGNEEGFEGMCITLMTASSVFLKFKRLMSQLNNNEISGS